MTHDPPPKSLSVILSGKVSVMSGMVWHMTDTHSCFPRGSINRLSVVARVRHPRKVDGGQDGGQVKLLITRRNTPSVRYLSPSNQKREKEKCRGITRAHEPDTGQVALPPPTPRAMR